MSWFRSLKISQKLIVIILSVTISIMVLLGAGQLLWQSSHERTSLVNEVRALALLIGDRSDAALAFNDQSLAYDNLSSLGVIPHISYACLYRVDASLMSEYSRSESKSHCPSLQGIADRGNYFDLNGLHYTQEIIRAGQVMGWIHIGADLSTIEKRFKQQIIFTLLALVLAAAIGIVMANRLQRIISRPIEAITEIADTIEEQGDHQLRVTVQSEDEVGRLARSFNNMLDALEQNRQQLIAAKDEQLAAFSLYRNLIESTSAIPWEMNPHEWVFTFVGHQAEEMFGYPIADWYHPGFLVKHIHVDDRDALEKIRGSIVHQENEETDVRLISASGRTVWLHMEIKVIRKNGKPVRLQGFMLDVSETREHEEAIKSIAAGVSSGTGEAFFRDLVEQLTSLVNADYVFIAELDKNDSNKINTLAFTINGDMAQNISYLLAGTPCEKVIGKKACIYEENVRDLFPGDEFLVEYDVRFYIGLPLFDSKGKALGLISVMNRSPIANASRLVEVMKIFASRAAAEMERLTSDKWLRSKEYEQRQMLDSMVDGVITIDGSGVILSFNKAAEKLFGYTALEIIGQDVKRLMPEEFSLHHDEYMQSYLTTGQPKLIGIGRDVMGLRKDGNAIPIRLSVAELPETPDGKRRFIGSCLDLSLIKSQEEMLRRSQKMDALGKLTGGVAHDFNNMLGVILGYSDLLMGMLKEQPKLQHYAAEIRNAGERGAKLTKKLLSFSRASSTDTSVIDINRLLIDQQHMLEKTLTARIELVMDLEKDLWPVEIDRSDFDDAVLNMAINAMHSITHTGSIKLKTRNRTLGVPQARQYNLPAGNYVQFSIIDTGIGMDDSTRERVFDPFYSTKGDKGTGLGLSQVYGFVQRSLGAITVSSEPGMGSEFMVFFPAVSGQLTADKQGGLSTSKQDLSGSETILVVDDEPALLSLADDLLSAKGYRVLLASDAKHAISILEKDNVDLVLSDVIMPEMDGFELADYISREFPDIKVQLASGFSDDRSSRHSNEKLQKTMLRKPLKSEVLLKRIRELLD